MCFFPYIYLHTDFDLTFIDLNLRSAFRTKASALFKVVFLLARIFLLSEHSLRRRASFFSKVSFCNFKFSMSTFIFFKNFDDLKRKNN